MATETKHTVLHEVNTGNFKGELSKTDRGAQLVSIMRSFFYQGKVITQKINFLLSHLDELLYVLGEIKSERDKLNGSGKAPATKGDSGHA
jgi:hypothetical protein